MVGSGNGAKVASIAIGIVAAAALGSAIGRYGDRNRVLTTLRQVAILLVACAVTYGIGKLLHVSVS